MIEQLAAMPKYEAYKDSGAEWLGEIPAHWEIRKLKQEANVVLGKMLCTENKGNYQLKPYLKSKNIQWLNVDISSVDEMWFSSSEMEMYRLRYGDLILSEGGEVGKTCIWNNELDECYVQNSAHKVTFSKQNDSRFFLYLFFIVGNIGLFNSIVNKVSIAHLTRDKLTNIAFVFPPSVEQTTIAVFLDSKTAQIDQAVAIKEKQIALLKQRKQILIQNAVTRGLNPDTQMRDSGVKWIGEIPAHWEVKKLKYVAGDFMYGTSVDCNELGAGTPVLRIPNIGELDISFEDLKYAALTETETNRYLLKKNDILIVRTNGNPNLVGKSAIFAGEEDYMFASYLIRVKPKINIEPRFLIYAMNSFSIRGSLTHSSRTSAGNYNLNTQALGDCYLAYPSKEEQTGIVAHIEIESAKIDQAISIQQQQIGKLKEYKTTLINSAVTGKIKVPELSGEKNAA